MNSLDLIRMGLKNLFKRKVRTLLTVLGVIIGTASIVIMVSLGYGMNENFKNEIEKMGSLTIINVSPPYGMPSGGSSTGGKPPVLDDKSIDSIAKIADVSAVTPIVETSVKMVSGKYGAYVQIIGVAPETMDAFDFKIAEGRTLLKDDGLNLVMGSSVAMTFMDLRSRNYYYPGPDAKPKVDVMKDKLVMTFDMSYGEKQPSSPGGQPQNGQQKPPKLYKVKVVGLIQEGSQEKDYSVYMNINELQKLIKENEKNQNGQKLPGIMTQQNGYQRAMVKVKDMNDVQTVQAKIKDMGFEAYSLTDYLESMKKTAATIQMVLGGIGAISLLVAALGITNTMIMSIYERTREIGVMKVIGASLSDIRRIFLFESGMIGLMGGLLGLGFSELASLALNTFASGFLNFMGPTGEGSKVSIIPVWLALSVLVFATIVGLISGFYPARRAMKLSALEAIKTE
ncbi:ABC transporter permease [Clostridium thermarum]|uniref:ABC transporter permease n=1 Tax=Clostridium thermarum TaxID=1716543 RepID=UPI001121E685|nr:ABC transporter permease [Clostridium thermarum]